MKRIFCFLLSLLLFFTLVIPLHAEEEQPLSSKRISEEELATLYNPAYYNEHMDGITLTDKPIIKIYPCIFAYDLAQYPLEEMLARADQEANGFDYFIDGIRVFCIEVDAYPYVGKYLDERRYDNPFIKDLKTMGNTITVNETECKILDIYCFDDHEEGAFVYLITDQGVFVKCYKGYKTDFEESAIFTEEEFSEYAVSFSLHVKRVGLGYSPTFIEYAKRVYGTEKDYGTKYTQTIHITIAVAIGSSVLLLGSVGTFFFVRKKRKKSS